LDLKERALMLSQSLMWRSKPFPFQSWLTRLNREKWLQHLSTLILRPSLTENFEERWTASLVDTRANRSRQQESDLAKMTQGISGRGLQTELELVSQDGASLKTSRDTLPAGCMTYCQTWQQWVTEQRGDYSQRVKLAHPINASESSSWPTVTVGEEKYRILGDTQASKCLSAMAARGELAGQHDQASPSTTGKSQGLNPDWVCQLMGIPVGWVHPEGVRNRTDELRMLGNGVVPQTAAKAFTTLIQRMK
jgi:site-specific DNA-cytosine methylase